MEGSCSHIELHQSKPCKCGLYRSEPASDWSGCIVGQPQNRRLHNEKNDIRIYKRQKRKDKNSAKLWHRRVLKSANQNEARNPAANPNEIRNPAANQNAAVDKPANHRERIVTDAHLDSFYRSFGGSRRHIRSNQKFGKSRRAVTFSLDEEQLGRNSGKYRRAVNSTTISFGEDDDAFSEDCGMGERVKALKCVDENDTPVHPG